ncbi:MAG: sn-glycerol-3-phosphate ABC transporter ATP-binding protein UgpC [Planctomycetota bacterium]|nr:MAG: sn-glycerol-3-phosphate ABC transporter ATP-binding protein UgpC [Planctomycetota bacterium]
MSTLEFKQVQKRYGKNLVIPSFQLRIEDGEFIVFVGPSGCGKSTLLRMVAGLEEISEGELCIDGKRVNELPPRQRDIAMVFQNYALYPHMTVEENMGFGLKLRGISAREIREKVLQAAKILGLESLLNRRPKELSGGQRQRVAMGRAIVREPKVFLFDEPLSNLDAKLRVQMRLEIAKLHRQLGSTVIYVTHDQTEAMTLADRIVVLNKGEVQQVGAPMEVYENPSNVFVASFIGSPAMNLMEGILQAEESHVYFQSSHLKLALPFLEEEKKKGPFLAEYANQTVLLGIRPQDLEPLTFEEKKELSLSSPLLAQTFIHGKVELVEPLGGETFLYFTLGDQTWIGRSLEHSSFAPGQEIFFVPKKFHLFDKATEKAIYISKINRVSSKG